MKILVSIVISMMILLSIYGCKENEEVNVVALVSSSINGYSFDNELTNIPTNLRVELVFGKSVDLSALRDATSIKNGSSPVDFVINLSNAGSKAIIEATLTYNTSYTLEIAAQVITTDGASLKESIQIQFTTAADEIIRSMAPCSGTSDCLQAIEFQVNNSSLSFWSYANYPFDINNAIWEDLEQAIIVIHGQNRDADNYYNYLSSTLNELELSESTLLIAPWFRDESNTTTNDLYWSSSAWREGGNSSGVNNISSFAAVDSVLQMLNNKSRFPALKKVVITGHSSGAMFTDMYTLANSTEEVIDMDVEYVVANSQYFYYPLDNRFNEDTQSFYIPDDCSGYNTWPYGFINHPTYIAGIDQTALNNRFALRSLTYLLGNDTSNDPALNTSNCKATLLGSTRYQRGENRFAFMNEYFPDNHHSRVIVPSIGHDGEGMYKSRTFKNLLTDLIK